MIPSNATTAEIPESVVTQLSGYSVSEDTIVADATREANSFYGIGSLEQLKAFRDGWNNGTITITKVKLTADFDLSENNWYPIGTWEYPWFGIFDGNGHTINGLTANSTDADHKGLYANGDSVGLGETYGFFGIVGNGDASISNVSFTNVSINIYDGKDVGAVIGYVPSLAKFKAANASGSDKFISTDKWTDDSGVGSHNVTISGVMVSGSVKGASHIGGLVGKVYTSGTLKIENSINRAEVSGTGSNTAGFAGYINGPSATTFISCANYGAISNSAAGSVAGIATYASGATIFESCKNEGTLSSASGYVGGIIACMQETNDTLTFEDCENAGNISTTGIAAGIYAGNYGAAAFKGKIVFKGVLKNSGELACDSTKSGDVIGQFSEKGFNSLNALSDITRIDTSELNEKITLSFANKVNRGNDNYTISLNIENN